MKMPSKNTNVNSTASQDDFLWIAFGDIHDDTSGLAHIPEIDQANAIIITGDMTNFGGVLEAKQVIAPVQKYNEQIFAQIGNMDKFEVTDWLVENKWNLHTEVHEIAPDLVIFGVGASTITPFATPSEFPESKFAAWLEECWQKASSWKNTVLISHNPPKDTLCDDIGGNVHVGSSAVREFIEKNQPDICICGHIHEARNVDKIGRTTIINPGNFGAGGYVLLRYSNGKLSVELKQISK